jgi:hypothetical protein
MPTGTFTGICTGSYSKHYHLYLDYTLNTPQDPINNKSNITVHMWAQADSIDYTAHDSQVNSAWYKIWVGDLVNPIISLYHVMDFSNMAIVDLGSWTGDVAHNPDGSLALTLKGQFYLDANSCNGGNVSGTWTLPVIPRATNVTSFTFANNTLDGQINIGLDIKLAGASHTLTFKKDSQTITVKPGITASPYVCTFAASELNLIYDLTPNNVAATIQIICDTYNSSGTKIGSSTAASTVANIPAGIAPTASNLTAVEANNTVSAIVGAMANKFVQQLSKITFTIGAAAAGRGATITNYRVSFNGIEYSSTTAMSFTTAVIKNSGDNLQAVAKVTDSRGRTGNASLLISIMPYTPPNLDTYSLQRCDADGTPNDRGTYVHVLATGHAQSIVNGTEKNGLTYKIYSRLRGTTDWTLKLTRVDTDLVTNESDIVGDYPEMECHEFKIDAVDKFYDTFVILVISTTAVALSFTDKAVGVGKVWEHGALDVEGDAYINGDVYITGTISLSKDGIGVGKAWEHGSVDAASDIYEAGNKLSDKYLGKTAQAADSAKLGGLLPTTFLGANAKAADSDKWEGKHMLQGYTTFTVDCTIAYTYTYFSNPYTVNFGTTLPVVPTVYTAYGFAGRGALQINPTYTTTTGFQVILSNGKSATGLTCYLWWIAIY